MAYGIPPRLLQIFQEILMDTNLSEDERVHKLMEERHWLSIGQCAEYYGKSISWMNEAFMRVEKEIKKRKKENK